MITHFIGQDTRIDFDWDTSAGLDVVVAAASFDVIDNSSAAVTGVGTLVLNDDYPVELHIAEDAIQTRGNYTYTLTAVADDTGDATILSAGLLRVR